MAGNVVPVRSSGKRFPNGGVWLVYLVLGCVTLALFWRVQDFPFVSFDDGEYIVDNDFLKLDFIPHGIAWAFTTFRGGNWHPVTWLSHMLDYKLFGLAAGRHHLVNVVLHTANSLLLLGVLARLTGAFWRSAIVAALFALHPLHVESVAWVSERKDVLSTLFWILTMGAYLRYVARRTAGRYLAMVSLYTFGLLSKPTLVTLPLVLLLLDFWPLGRLRDRRDPEVVLRLILEKIPLLLLSLAEVAVTLYAPLQMKIFTSLETFPLANRIAISLNSYIEYVMKTVWPSGLAVVYHIPQGLPWRAAAVSLALLAATSGLLVTAAGKRPAPAVGWLWYLITLFPMSGLVHIGPQALADRYTYIPLVGLFMAFSYGVAPRPVPSVNRRRLLAAATAGALAACLVVGWRQVGFWRTSASLFERALAVTNDNYVAHVSLASVFEQEGRSDEAIAHLSQAIAIRPDYQTAHNDLAVALEKRGLQEEARAHYQEAVRLAPGYADAHWNLAHLLIREKLPREAAHHFREYFHARPDDENEYIEAATALLELQATSEAEEIFRALLDRKPGSAQGHHELGVMLGSAGRCQEALGEFSLAAKLAPDNPAVQYNLAAALEGVGDREGAVSHYRRAIELGVAGTSASERLRALRAGEANPVLGRTP